MHEAIERLSEMTTTWLSVAQILSDSQQVVAMRLLGLTGIWSVPAEENIEMISEKAPAIAEAFFAGALTALSGRGPDRVMQAVLAPISEKTSANRARLYERGPQAIRLFEVAMKSE